MQLVRALDLEQWSETVSSRTALPKWVAALIRATADISAIRFPSGDMGEMRGFDGRLESSGFSPFVPVGKSVWEFGTGADPREKANGDYRDRTDDPRDVEPLSATFVFVTSRPWERAPEWASEKRAEKK